MKLKKLLSSSRTSGQAIQLVGLAVVAVGSGMVWPPAGLLVAGVEMVAVGVLLELDRE